MLLRLKDKTTSQKIKYKGKLIARQRNCIFPCSVFTQQDQNLISLVRLPKGM